ncbi:MAG: alpha/beta hydrolase [Pelobium sp.]
MTNSDQRSNQILFAHSGGEQGELGKGSFDLVSFIKQQLSNEYDIHYPIIDEPEAPTYKMWKKLFSKEFKRMKQPLILVGHSLGGTMLIKYLSEEKPKVSISAMCLISTPYWGKNGWDVEDFALVENFENELEEINNVFLYNCKEDTIVPFKHMNFYKRSFPNSIVRILNGTDHAFATGLPQLVSDIKAIKRG